MTLMLAVMKSEPTLRGACSQDRQGSQAGAMLGGRHQAMGRSDKLSGAHYEGHLQVTSHRFRQVISEVQHSAARQSAGPTQTAAMQQTTVARCLPIFRRAGWQL